MTIWKRLKRSSSGLAMVAIATSTASAQYSPFGPINTGGAGPQQYSAPQQNTAQPQYQQPQYQQHGAQQPQYAAPPGGQGVPYMASRATGYPATGALSIGPRFAMDPAAAASAAAQVLPTPPIPQAEAVTPPAGAPVTPAPMGNSYPAPSYPSSSITPTPAPMTYSEGYGAPCNNYPMTDGCAPPCDVGYTLPKRQWFAGMYGLFMQRSNPGRIDLGVLVTGTPTYPYYPAPGDTVLHSSPDSDYQGGAEIRFGSTLGQAGCGCNCYQPYAWEVGYWGLAEDTNQEVLTANPFTGNTRMYGMVNYAGLEYDRDGAGTTYGYRPMNEYTDYQNPINPPATPNDIRVLGIRVRESFTAQNLELNLWRFGNPGGLSSTSPCGGGACNSCSPCGGYSACDPCAKPQRLFVNGLLGVRYFRVDNDLSIAGEFADATDTTNVYDGTFNYYHDVNVDNKLVGFQLGGSANYAVTCKLSAFLDTNFGIYGNDMETRQRVYSAEGGTIRDVRTGALVDYHTSKSDVAFLGEARLGMGYQFSPCWRATAAWRVLALSGVAIAGEQVPANGFPNSAQINYIDSNDSIILHGLQAGVECKF
jgi:hypothetical protein